MDSGGDFSDFVNTYSAKQLQQEQGLHQIIINVYIYIFLPQYISHPLLVLRIIAVFEFVHVHGVRLEIIRLKKIRGLPKLEEVVACSSIRF